MSYDDLHLITRWAQVVQLRDDGLLTPAELTLIEQAGMGEVARVGETLPTLKAPQVLIRAALLRYLILGGCAEFRTQPSGITLVGAWISGPLDLSFTQARGPIDLYRCHLAETPQMVQLQVDGLAIVRSALPQGLNAARIQVAGNVTLNESTSGGKISLSGAVIKGHLSCTQASLRNEGGSALKAQGVSVASSILMTGASASGLVSFLGSQIGGQLVCTDAAFHNPEGHALNAQSLRVQGDVFLRRAVMEGEVSFLGVEINGVLDFSGATLRSARLALNAGRLVVREGFVWRKITDVNGAVDLTSAHVGDLWDDRESWALCDQLTLSGFRYDVLHGEIDVDDRLAWLRQGAISKREFYPQPYEHLAKLLRDTGHGSDARAIMIAKEQEQRAAARNRWRREIGWRRDLRNAARLPDAERAEAVAALTRRRPHDEDLARLNLLHPKAGDAGFVDPATLSLGQHDFRREQRMFEVTKTLRIWGSLIADRVFGLVVGYGHRPERSFYVLLMLVAVGCFLAERAWDAGDFAPAMGPVLMSEGWQMLATDARIANPAQVWSDKFMLAPDGASVLTPGRDYETFHPLAYAVDTVVPIVSLGQEASWAPSTTRGPWGWWLWWIRWLLISFGWIVTAIGAAAVTGVIRRE